MQQEETSTSTSTTRAKNGKWKAEASTAKDEVMDKAQPIVEQAQKAYETVVDKASSLFSGFDASPTRYIRQYPIQAAIGGVVIGFLLGAAVCRRSVSE